MQIKQKSNYPTNNDASEVFNKSLKVTIFMQYFFYNLSQQFKLIIRTSFINSTIYK